MRLIGIRDPCPGFCQFGHPFRCRLTLDTFHEPLVKGGKEFFRRCHRSMLARDVSPILERRRSNFVRWWIRDRKAQRRVRPRSNESTDWNDKNATELPASWLLQTAGPSRLMTGAVPQTTVERR
jgi:hypothetical protein